MFLVWTPGTWGEPMFAGGHFFPISTTRMVSGSPEWPISGDTDRWNWQVVCPGKRGMVRAGGSASRIIGDQGTTDPGGGVGGSRRGQPAWQLPVGHGLGIGWASNTQAFLPLGSHSTEFVDRMTGSCRAGPKWFWEVGTLLCRSLRSGWIRAHHRWSPRCPELGNMGGGCGLPEGIGGFHRE